MPPSESSRRPLQLREDSAALLSSPKQGLLQQYLQLKTRHSFSKCSRVLSSPRSPKSEDDLVVVHAQPKRPGKLGLLGSSIVAGTSTSLERSFRKQNSHQSTHTTDKRSTACRADGSCSDDALSRACSSSSMLRQSSSSFSRSGLAAMNNSFGSSARLPPRSSVEDNNPSSHHRVDSRYVSPLKMETGLANMTIHEARNEYKRMYPADHPPVLTSLHRSKRIPAKTTE